MPGHSTASYLYVHGHSVRTNTGIFAEPNKAANRILSVASRAPIACCVFNAILSHMAASRCPTRLNLYFTTNSGRSSNLCCPLQNTSAPLSRMQALDNCAVLTGILFVLQIGLRCDLLPREMGCGSGVSRWRRLRNWQDAGVREQFHEWLLAQLRAADQSDWSS